MARKCKEVCFDSGGGGTGGRGRGIKDKIDEATDHINDKNNPHEAQNLNVSSEKAAKLLHWHPVWDFETAVEKTAVWYYGAVKNIDNAAFIRRLTQQQIEMYGKALTK